MSEMEEKKYHPASPKLFSVSDLWIKVIPRASSNAVIGWENGILKLKVQAVPEDGRANKAVIEVLASHWGIPKRSIIILSGEKSRQKRIQVKGVDIHPS
ncbi:MAG: DUF167 domain-containing protein [Puniceicoccales bacterium]|jgi:uncharacterized protein (TIGR00251 family)|nr:DUF167 domain-containing protein [Puniceicoccales bacterium]